MKEKFLLIKGKGQDGKKLWHPIIDEMELPFRARLAIDMYQELETEARVESLVPLKFSHDIENEPYYQG